jgi:putative transposase
MKGFKSPRHVQRFLSTHDQIANVFSRSPLASAASVSSARTQAFTHWAEVTGVAMAAWLHPIPAWRLSSSPTATS